MMKHPVVLIGVGEMGGVFGRGLLKLGHPVFPVIRIAGLRTGGTVAALWADHRELAEQVGHEVIAIQEGLTGRRFDRGHLFAALEVAFAGDPEHACMSRSAPARLARALRHGDALGLELPVMRSIAASIQPE